MTAVSCPVALCLVWAMVQVQIGGPSLSPDGRQVSMACVQLTVLDLLLLRQRVMLDIWPRILLLLRLVTETALLAEVPIMLGLAMNTPEPLWATTTRLARVG